MDQGEYLESGARSGTDRVRECHIVITGSEQELNPTTGSYRITRREFLECKADMNMSLADFLIKTVRAKPRRFTSSSWSAFRKLATPLGPG
jgi:hypothetical protein